MVEHLCSSELFELPQLVLPCRLHVLVSSLLSLLSPTLDNSIRITTLWLHVSPKTVGFQPSDSFVAPEATHVDFTFAILLPLTQSMDLTKGFQTPIRSIDPMGNILWWIGTYPWWRWSHLLILFLGIGLLDSFSLLFLTIQPFTFFLFKGSPLLSFNLLGNSPLSLIFFTTHLAYHLCIRPLFLPSFLFLSFTAL